MFHKFIIYERYLLPLINGFVTKTSGISAIYHGYSPHLAISYYILSLSSVNGIDGLLGII